MYAVITLIFKKKKLLMHHNHWVAIEDYDLFDNGILILSLPKKKQGKDTSFNSKDLF